MTNSTPATMPTAPVPAAHDVDDALDEALDESFPASDPVAINTGAPAPRAG